MEYNAKNNAVDANAVTDASIGRIAIANPKHAPYGARAQQVLQVLGLWQRLQPKLVYGDNIAHTAQLVQSGNAQVGFIALALTKSTALSNNENYYLIPQALYQPLEQGCILTRHAQNNASALLFFDPKNRS